MAPRRDAISQQTLAQPMRNPLNPLRESLVQMQHQAGLLVRAAQQTLQAWQRGGQELADSLLQQYPVALWEAQGRQGRLAALGCITHAVLQPRNRGKGRRRCRGPGFASLGFKKGKGDKALSNGVPAEEERLLISEARFLLSSAASLPHVIVRQCTRKRRSRSWVWTAS